MAEGGIDLKCKVIPDLPRCGIEIKSLPNKGHGLFATKIFKENDILFEESPLASCQFPWNEDYGYLACHYCMRPLETAEQNIRRLCKDNQFELPYREMCGVLPVLHTKCKCGVTYCSSECQELAWSQFHLTLCDQTGIQKEQYLRNLREVWKKMHYPPETASVMLIIRLFASVHQAENKEVAIGQLQDFVMNTTSEGGEICHKLLGTKFKKDIDVLRAALEQTVDSLGLDIPPSWKTSAAFLHILGLIALNGQGIGTSAFSQWLLKVEDLSLGPDESVAFQFLLENLYSKVEEVTGLDFMNSEGSGLYPCQSKINHSCDPNVEVAFTNGNHTLVIRAIRDILPGQEICSSYLESCSLSRSRHSRQAILRENYLFTCLCPRCEEQAIDPDETSEDDSEEEMSS